MAKLLCFVALLVASAVLLADAAHAAAPAPAPARHVHPHGHHAHGKVHPHTQPNHPYHTYSLKFIIHNVADRDVTFKAVIYRKEVSAPVVAKAGQWTAIGPVKVGIELEVVEIVVIVKNNKGEEVTVVFLVKLTEFLKNIKPNSSESVVLVASEETWKGQKSLVVEVNNKVAVIEKL